jgi:hypothetical protein
LDRKDSSRVEREIEKLKAPLILALSCKVEMGE